ncbi:MAG: putative sugar nucleotidyl transferase [Muribaculaceae bacterium]
MKNVILFDDTATRDDLLPLTYTRPIADIRFGITTIRQKWERAFKECKFSYFTTPYLQPKFRNAPSAESLFIAGHICPNADLVAIIEELNTGEALLYNNELIAFYGTLKEFKVRRFGKRIFLSTKPLGIRMLYDIFMFNDKAIIQDYKDLTIGRSSQVVGISNHIIGNAFFPDGSPKIFIEAGAKVEGAYLNVNNGPIYIGKDAEIMEGSAIRAPFVACEHTMVNMGTKIYGATTIGPYSKVGGELNNVVIIGYSNKAHDGFLGNAVIGEWCNIGAGTNASNLKNDYTEIKLWNYPAHRFLKTGLQFCGLIMGDHSKAGINCMFNTATVIGVGVNIHGAGFPRNFVASFSEGSTAGFTDVSLPKFFNIAERVMARRNVSLSEIDRRIFESIYTIADTYK